MEIKDIGKKQQNTSTPEVYADLLKKMRKEHDKPVKGMFEFVDAQGGWLDFSYRFFKGDPLRTMRLVHGEICELPMGLVKHLNNTIKKVRHFGLQTGARRGNELPEGRGIPSTYEKQSRIRFTPTEYI